MPKQIQRKTLLPVRQLFFSPFAYIPTSTPTPTPPTPSPKIKVFPPASSVSFTRQSIPQLPPVVFPEVHRHHIRRNFLFLPSERKNEIPIPFLPFPSNFPPISSEAISAGAWNENNIFSFLLGQCQESPTRRHCHPLKTVSRCDQRFELIPNLWRGPPSFHPATAENYEKEVGALTRAKLPSFVEHPSEARFYFFFPPFPLPTAE